MKESIRHKLEHLQRRLVEVDQLLAAPDVTADINEFKKLARERAGLEPLVSTWQEYSSLERHRGEAVEMLSDPELKDMAAEEISNSDERLPLIANELQRLLIPDDPDDDRDVILEIRAGTGGEESALFAADLFRMYKRLVERQNWQLEVLSASESDLGGFREIICRLVGERVYSRLKFESGGHRVQRVPDTETQGRIHTSACTVAVMPEADELEEIELNPTDLRIDTYRASGAGGQHVNKTDSAVRITHLPTGMVAECQDGRSQHQNRLSAMRVLAARMHDIRIREQQQQLANTRKSLIGSGDRSERIRTYNFPQGRVTDHRINLTLHKIGSILDGDLEELFNALAAEHQAELLAALGDTGD